MAATTTLGLKPPSLTITPRLETTQERQKRELQHNLLIAAQAVGHHKMMMQQFEQQQLGREFSLADRRPVKKPEMVEEPIPATYAEATKREVTREQLEKFMGLMNSLDEISIKSEKSLDELLKIAAEPMEGKSDEERAELTQQKEDALKQLQTHMEELQKAYMELESNSDCNAFRKTDAYLAKQQGLLEMISLMSDVIDQVTSSLGHQKQLESDNQNKQQAHPKPTPSATAQDKDEHASQSKHQARPEPTQASKRGVEEDAAKHATKAPRLSL